MAPNFTGRQNRCNEIVTHLTSKSTRLVSIWGSPGFGKTSVAIAVGHDLQSQGLPVYWLPLRGLKSKSDLISKLLSFVRHLLVNDEPSFQRLSSDDQLCQLFKKISDDCVFILDNGDDLLESGEPKVKEEVIGLLQEILKQSEKVKLIVTTRESFEYINLNFQGHKAFRIRPLDEASSKALVHELLPDASISDIRRITQICGHVPLAIKLLCSSISDSALQSSQFLNEFMETSTESTVEMLDNPDYPADLRLQFLFDSSFQRLSSREKQALVSLCILPENFPVDVAAAVLEKSKIFTEKVLQSLRRKSLLDLSSETRSFTMHKLLQSFAREKGEHEMKETVVSSIARFYAFYISRFEKLNGQFLTGDSMSAFVTFCEDKETFIHSLTKSCSDSRIADQDRVFDVLVKAELFLDSIFWCSSEADKIFSSALRAASLHGKNVYYRRLLVSKAFGEITRGADGMAMQLLSEVEKIHTSSSNVPSDERAKYLCYLGIYQLVNGETENGVRGLREAISLMDNGPEHTVLTLVAFQVLAVYYQFQSNASASFQYYSKALQTSSEVGDARLVVIPATERAMSQTTGGKSTLYNEPLKLQVVYHVKKASEHFSDKETQRCLQNVLLSILSKVEAALPRSEPGLFNFHRIVVSTLRHFSRGDDTQLMEEELRNCQTALEQCRKRFGEEHSSTADSYHLLGNTQHNLGDLSSALESKQRALDIRRALFGEEHLTTADSYHSLGVTQHDMGDFSSAAQSKQRGLDIRHTLFGEDNTRTAHSYHSLGNTQHNLGELSLALQSKQRTLDIRRPLFGEDHSSTADSYDSLGVTLHELGDFTSALHFKQRGLDIRRTLFGEKTSTTAESYDSLGVTLHELGDFTSALTSKQCALDIRRALFGEENSTTAESYDSLGVTQYELGDFTSALKSDQCALDIRRTLFGEEHPSTADSYHSLGVTQHNLGDFSSALVSKQSALNIRRRLIGDEHSSTADSYHSLGITQHSLGDFSSALESKQRALDIRNKMFGMDHHNTLDSYGSLLVTQDELVDITALQSELWSQDIGDTLFGDNPSSTAESNDSLVSQYEQGDFSSDHQ